MGFAQTHDNRASPGRWIRRHPAASLGAAAATGGRIEKPLIVLHPIKNQRRGAARHGGNDQDRDRMTRLLAGYFAWSNRGVMLSKMISTSGTKCAPISFKIKAATRSRPTLRLTIRQARRCDCRRQGLAPLRFDAMVSSSWSARTADVSVRRTTCLVFSSPRSCRAQRGRAHDQHLAAELMHG